MSLPIPLVVVRPLAPQDWLSLAEVLGQSFNAAPMGWDVFRDRLGDENFRVVWEGDRMVGGCGVYPMGQVWGGKASRSAAWPAWAWPPTRAAGASRRR